MRCEQHDREHVSHSTLKQTSFCMLFPPEVRRDLTLACSKVIFYVRQRPRSSWFKFVVNNSSEWRLRGPVNYPLNLLKHTFTPKRKENSLRAETLYLSWVLFFQIVQFAVSVPATSIFTTLFQFWLRTTPAPFIHRQFEELIKQAHKNAIAHWSQHIVQCKSRSQNWVCLFWNNLNFVSLGTIVGSIAFFFLTCTNFSTTHYHFMEFLVKILLIFVTIFFSGLFFYKCIRNWKLHRNPRLLFYF